MCTCDIIFCKTINITTVDNFPHNKQITNSYILFIVQGPHVNLGDTAGAATIGVRANLDLGGTVTFLPEKITLCPNA